jgi:hypothetical protein
MDEEAQGAGWLTFAAILLVFAGLMKLFDAIWAFRAKGNLGTASFKATFGDKISSYGWIWLLVGIVLILAGFAVLQRSQLGRWIGIIAAVIGAITAMSWMPYFPVWALTYVFLAVLVIYALAAHGGLDVPAVPAMNTGAPPAPPAPPQ